MLPATIRPAVSPRAIEKASRLFNGTIQDIVNELFQNARRADATLINITFLTENTINTIVIEDNGSGIASPAEILTLGDSGWGTELRAIEDPGGMGFFSLSGRKVSIASRCPATATNWAMTIGSDDWTGASELPVNRAPDDFKQTGTRISFELGEISIETCKNACKNAALYLPVAVHIAGEPCPTKEFLLGAIHTEKWNGATIGIYRHPTPAYDHYRPNANFHGLTLRTKLPSIAEIDGTNYSACVDIGPIGDLALVLPARKEFVANEALRELQTAIRTAIFRAIKAQGSHTLPFEIWQSAHDLGVSLKPARKHLIPWQPAIADSSSTFEDGNAAAIGKNPIIMDSNDPTFDQSVYRAVHNHPICARLVEAEPKFKGYAWYDALATVDHLSIRVITNDAKIYLITPCDTLPMPKATAEAERITLQFHVSRPGKSRGEKHHIDSDIAFASDPDNSWWGLADSTLFYRPNDQLTVNEVSWLLKNAYFAPSDDTDSDSWQTQEYDFSKSARNYAISLLCSEDEALASRVREAIEHIIYTAPKGKCITAQITSEGIAVTILDQAA